MLTFSEADTIVSLMECDVQQLRAEVKRVLDGSEPEGSDQGYESQLSDEDELDELEENDEGVSSTTLGGKRPRFFVRHTSKGLHIIPRHQSSVSSSSSPLTMALESASDSDQPDLAEDFDMQVECQLTGTNSTRYSAALGNHIADELRSKDKMILRLKPAVWDYDTGHEEVVEVLPSPMNC